MPKRVYRCPMCGGLEEHVEKWEQQGKWMCRECEQPMKLIFQPPAIVMKEPGE